MQQNSFSFKKKEGTNFAKLSGDYNVIHVNEIAGYNSIYGENIVHGVFVIFKFLEKIKIKNNFNYIKILFNDAARYNHKITIRKINISKERKLYKLIQLNNDIAKIEVGLLPQNIKHEEIKKISLQKKYLINKKKIIKSNYNNVEKNLSIALCKLSNYVGMVFPGENSLIAEISIYKKKNKL